MTEVETIAGSTPNGVKPGSTDENPGAAEMSRVPATPVPGVQRGPDFGATDPAAARLAPNYGENGDPLAGTAPFQPTALDADPVRTVEIGSSDGPDFAGIKERAQAEQENRLVDYKTQASADAGGNPYAAGSSPEPTIGRIVLYTLSQEDADRINVRRVYGPKGEDGSALEEGGSMQAGVQYPAIITSVGDRVVNLHVFADGNHGVWIKDAAEGTTGGSWAWPEMKR